MKFTAIILAGGQSHRMGTNKALLSFRGKQLIGYALDLARELTDFIIISANTTQMAGFGYPVISDQLPVQAPLSGIHAGLTVSQTDWNLVLTCDMPNVTSGLIRYLMSGLEEGLMMVLPGHGGFIEPLCGFYHKSLVAGIEGGYQRKEYSPVQLMRSVSHKIVPVEGIRGLDPDVLFRNFNEPRDLEE